jgi:hypothetical protein
LEKRKLENTESAGCVRRLHDLLRLVGRSVFVPSFEWASRTKVGQVILVERNGVLASKTRTDDGDHPNLPPARIMMSRAAQNVSIDTTNLSWFSKRQTARNFLPRVYVAGVRCFNDDSP